MEKAKNTRENVKIRMKWVELSFKRHSFRSQNMGLESKRCDSKSRLEKSH